ncbi:unnamed protein product [Triticum turgidum subsp. durum]|uniref:Kinesin motor domain-containing protein n=1 Tax=Triticum turgidum subsp. durum TaxID=4567 RepID=A0A9R0RIZ1_TRITD|nr:unnamed protein product [Triticum turgidum subsp. durum]
MYSICGYGPQSIEEKQKLYMLLRSLNFNGESASAPISEPYTPTTQSFSGGPPINGFYSPELRGEYGAGLLDLHAMDDSELLSENVASEPFEASPFVPKETDDDEDDIISGSQQGLSENYGGAITSEKDSNTKESNVAKIKVVVRKRPLNRKEISRKEDDVIDVHNSQFLTVHEPKLKMSCDAVEANVVRETVEANVRLSTSCNGALSFLSQFHPVSSILDIKGRTQCLKLPHKVGSGIFYGFSLFGKPPLEKMAYAPLRSGRAWSQRVQCHSAATPAAPGAELRSGGLLNSVSSFC